MAQSTQAEIDRALSTAREAWTANHEDEVEERASQLEQSIREKLQAEFDEEKRQLVHNTLREGEITFKNEKRKFEEEQRKVNLY